jgi:hypothetical protein
VSGAFRSEQDLAAVNFAIGGRMLRLSDIARVHRGYADPPQPQFRVNGKPALGLAIAMREGGDILALGDNIKAAMAKITASLPVGIEPILIADQAVTVEDSIAEFTSSLWQAVAIFLVVSFISLGIRPGLVVAFAIPLTLAIVFAIMELAGIDMQRISLGALIIALALLVDDAMTTTDAVLRRLAAGDGIVAASTYAFRKYAFAMLAGTLVTIAGFVPVGFAASSAGEYTFSLFAVVAIALIVSWFASEFDPAEIPHGRHSETPPGVVVALLPLAVVILVNLAMSVVVLPRLDTSFLAEERWGATSLAAVGGVWAVVVALLTAILTLVALNCRAYHRSRQVWMPARMPRCYRPLASRAWLGLGP